MLFSKEPSHNFVKKYVKTRDIKSNATIRKRKTEKEKIVIGIIPGFCASAEDNIPDFHDLDADIERQFHELSALDDAIFIDG